MGKGTVFNFHKKRVSRFDYKKVEKSYIYKAYLNAIDDNSRSATAEKRYAEHAEAVEESIDYILGLTDYRALSNQAKRVMFYILSCINAKLNVEIKLHWDNISNFLHLELLVPYRKSAIYDFIFTLNETEWAEWQDQILWDSFKRPQYEAALVYQTGKPLNQVRTRIKLLHKFERKV